MAVDGSAYLIQEVCEIVDDVLNDAPTGRRFTVL